MKTFLLSILLIISFSLFAQQTASEVLDKHRAFLGGKDGINAIKTAELKGQLRIQGMTIPVKIQLVQDKAVRIEADIMGAAVVSAYKDGIGWKLNPYGGIPDPKQVSAEETDEIKEQANIASPLLELADDDSLFRLDGEEVVNGIKTLRLVYENPNDKSETIFNLHSDTYSLLRSKRKKTVAMNQISEVETWYGEPREFNGVKVYMERVQKAGNEELQRMTLTAVAVDVPVDESIFVFPKPATSPQESTPATPTAPTQVAPQP